jgi:hypothetical protein
MSTAEAFRKTLICDVGETPHLIGYPDFEKPAVQRVAKPPQVRRPEKVGAIDEFAVEKLAMGGWITRKKFNAEIDALNLIVEGTRFCRRIGREHRSNHSHISCRLNLGTMVQKCTDPDCRGFQSEAVEIPLELLEELRREYAPGQVFSSQKVKTFNVEAVDIEEILADTGTIRIVRPTMGLPIETEVNQQLFSKREIRVDKSKCESMDEGELKYRQKNRQFQNVVQVAKGKCGTKVSEKHIDEQHSGKYEM